MKRFSILTFTLGLFTMSAAAQGSFTFTPSDTVVQNIPDNSYTQIYIYEENQTSDSLTLGVEIVAKDIPSSWDGMVCIYGFCLVNFPVVGFTSEMAPIHDTIDGYVRVTANPMGSTESGSISVRVFNADNPMDSDTCTFILNPQNNTSVEDHETAMVSMFPNPSSTVVTLTSDRTFNSVRILGMDGSMVWNDAFNSTLNRQLILDQLSQGNYLVELRSDQELITRKRLVINE